MGQQLIEPFAWFFGERQSLAYAAKLIPGPAIPSWR